MFYFLAGQITSKKLDGDTNIFVLNQVRIRQYQTQVAPSIIVSDYTSSIRYNGKNPIIVGRCNISTEPQAIIMSKTFAKPDIPYDFLAKYKQYFTDGFVISTNIIDKDKLTEIIDPDMQPIGAKVLWKVKYMN